MTKENKNYQYRLVLLDMNAILHRGYHALPDFKTSDGEPTGALYGLCLMLLSIIDDLDPDEIVATYDLAAPTHRHEKFAEYKAHREETDAALVSQIEKSRQILQAFSIPYYEKKGFEADDLLGTIAEKMKSHEDTQVVIASGDHDTLQLVDEDRTVVYTQRRGIKDTVLYDEPQVKDKYGFGPEYIPDFKGLMGDSSDNIPGIDGVGEKTATRVIENFGHLENAYEKLTDAGVDFAEAGISSRFATKIQEGEDEAIFSKELATIRLDADIDFTLPETPWHKRLDYAEITETFDRFEFGSLRRRVKQELFEDEAANGSKPDEGSEPDKEFSETKRKALAVAVWLCDSTKTDPTKEEILTYTDTKTLTAAWDSIQKELEKKELKRLFEEIERPLIPVVAKMENTGVAIDTAYLEDLKTEYETRLTDVRQKIYDLAGQEFNINSPKQLREVMFQDIEIPTSGLAKTSTGNISTSESELKKLEDDHEIATQVLAYRGVQKLLSTYIDVLLERTRDDGRLYAEFIQSGTTTGRMSAKNPNLQNIPVRSEDGKKIRGAFVAADGYKLAALDYSQIELRIAAWLSGDERLTEVFREDKDVHATTAASLFAKPKDAVTKNERSKAKVINYGILYGMGVNALRSNLGDDTTKEQARQYLDDYLDTYEGLAEFMETKKQAVRNQGYTTTYFGRRRYFPEIYSSRSWVQARAEREAINAPIQGTQADIIKKAMVAIADDITDDEAVRMLMQVHDELVFEIKEGEIETVVKKIADKMETVLPKEETGGITMEVDAAVGDRWNDLKAHSSS
jgi:DNA polymerase-1